MDPARRDSPAEAPLSDLLDAGVGDGLTIDGRTYAIAMVGTSHGPQGFETREYTLGPNQDLYLVIEGQLAAGDPRHCRAVLTYELNAGEVRCPLRAGQRPLATFALRQSGDPPAEVVYQGRRYRFLRRIEAQYSSPQRESPRINWDFELDGRNLAIERWSGGEMAVYEGRIVPLNRIGVRPGYGRSHPAQPVAPAELGVFVGIVLMCIGGALLAS